MSAAETTLVPTFKLPVNVPPPIIVKSPFASKDNLDTLL